MNKNRFLTFVLLIGTLLLSACGAAATTATPAAVSAATQNVDVMPVSFVGIVDSMAGDQWVISGTTVTVDQSIVRDGPFSVGDFIKVEGFVSPNGSFQVSRVETPNAQDVLTATPFAVDNSNDANANDNANVNDGNINDDNSNSLNSNDDNSNTVNSNDDNGGSNSNDDNGGSNSNDDHGGGSNSNDDNGGGGGGSNDDNGNGG